jgi:RHS repeat-associated protein
LALQKSQSSTRRHGSIRSIDADHLNTPRLVADATGTTVWRWDQVEPFGNNPADEDPDANLVAFDLPLRLPGQRYDKETNLHYNYFRDFDPATGRYPQSDPIGLAGGLNTYLYVNADPLRQLDLYGVAPTDLPTTDDCKRSEWTYCETACAPRKVAGCYVSVNWKMRGIRGGHPIRSEERTVNCNCEDPPTCGTVCKTLIFGGLVIAGACLAGPFGGLAGGLVGIGAQ